MGGARSDPGPVGNDVVDLADSRCRDRWKDERFLTRVFAEQERGRILAASDSNRSLWRAWAAKEAAFKVVSKLEGGPPPFRHGRFRITTDEAGGGVVTYRDLEIPFREEPSGPREAVHVLAWSPGPEPYMAARVEDLPPGPPPIETLTDRERRAVYSAASGWVRLLARSGAAGLLGMPADEIEIACHPGPPGRAVPHLLVRGKPGAWDVSLSHHGRFLAWALLGPGPAEPPARAEAAQEGR